MAKFVHHDLRLLNPTFSSPLLDVITDLEHLRRRQMRGTTPFPVFLQLKRVFHMLESLASARIEGNHTTLADYVEAMTADQSRQTEPLREIGNIEVAMRHVEAAVGPDFEITEALLRELHALTVAGLSREGDRTPGAYRSGSVRIAQADHVPPEHLGVPAYMSELMAFVNRGDAPKYDLMKVALAHHRFAWIHPFTNGNGRVVRLFTYALLLKYGFRVSLQPGDFGRLLNPAAVFCADRARYYDMLRDADCGSDAALEAWCRYVLSGIRDELNKIDELADYSQLQARVLLPALAHARERQWLNAQEAAVLSATIREGVVKSSDLIAAMPALTDTQRTYQVRKLVERGMLQPIQAKARQYTVGFSNNMLLRGVVQALRAEGFIPTSLDGP